MGTAIGAFADMAHPEHQIGYLFAVIGCYECC